MIRILLAEDQAMVRGALSALLGLEADIEVLGSAADGETAWRMLQQLQPPWTPWPIGHESCSRTSW